MKTHVKIQLGSNSASFYMDNKKGYTEIIENKMPHTVLNILKDGGLFGIHPNILNASLLERRPDLSVDTYGKSVSLPMLLKDFEKCGIIEYRNSSYIVITKLGHKFLQNNVIVEDDA